MSGRLWVHEQITKDVRWGNTFKRGDTDDNDHIVFVFYDELQYGIQKVWNTMYKSSYVNLNNTQYQEKSM